MQDYTFGDRVMRIMENDRYFRMSCDAGQYWDASTTDFLKPWLSFASCVVDVGAHVGFDSVSYAHHAPHAIVHAFEPQTHLFNLLKHNVNVNKSRVVAYNVAVGHTTCLTSMDCDDCDPRNDGMWNHGGVSLGIGGQACVMVPLDSLHLRPQVIKMDVEGAEALVLMGAQHTIGEHKPVLCIEQNSRTINDNILRASGLQKVPSVDGFLRELGYHVIQRIGDDVIAVPV